VKDWKQAERRVARLLGGRRVLVTGRQRGDVTRLARLDVQVLTATAD